MPRGSTSTRFVGSDDRWLPPDNVQFDPEPRIAHRTSPTNIAMSLLASVSAHDLGFIDSDALVERLEATLTTIDRLEHFEGHLLNWYDTQNLMPLLPKYVSTVDSGNYAAALLTLSATLRELAGSQADDDAGRSRAARMIDLADRANAYFDEMRFGFLYDRKRQLFAIGYRLADQFGGARLDTSFYDLLASEARLASFIAIAKGDVPERHWFHLGRLITSVRGSPVLLSWSATMFEYLMPLLLMRNFPETLLDESCRMAVRRQIDYGLTRGTPWGISESAYTAVDRAGNYQYKAFGVPGLGLKRGLGDELVIAPYATALAVMVDPARSAKNLRRLAAEGLFGEYGFFEAVDYTDRSGGNISGKGTPVTALFAHHAGMSLIALANAINNDLMVRRFHSDPRIRATELLLQERVPRQRPVTEPRPEDVMSVSPQSMAVPLRRYRTPHTIMPHTQFLSNGKYAAAVTHAGGGASFSGRMAVTRSRRDATTDPGSNFIYLRDIRSGEVWSPTFLPIRREPERYLATFQPEIAVFDSKAEEIAAKLEIAVSPEHDVEVRLLHLVNHSDRVREIDVTSYVEIALAQARDDYAHPAFGKLFIETEYLPERSALICHRRPRDSRDPGTWAVHVLGLDGRAHGPIEWETDRAQFIGRGRTLDRPQALDGRPLSGSTGFVLDPILSLRQRVRLPAGESVRICFATGVADDRETARALALTYRDPSTAMRTLALALAHAQGLRRHMNISNDDAVLFERLASRVIGTDASLRASADLLATNELGQNSLWPHGISGDLPILLVRVVDDDLTVARQALEAQEYWRLKGLWADLVILNEHPVSYLDEVQSRLTALMDEGPWRMWKHQQGGAFMLRSDTMGRAERALFHAVAQAVLESDRGDLRAHLARPPQTPLAAAPLPALAHPEAPHPPAQPSLNVGLPALTHAKRVRRLCRRRPNLRDRPRRRSGHAGAVGERDREPALRHHPERERIGDDVVREQPRESPDAVRQRSGDRSRRRSALHSRRRHRTLVVADTGADATVVDERPNPHPPRSRHHAVLPIVRGNPPPARRAGRSRRSGAHRAAHARQHVRKPPSCQRLRLQRLGHRAAARARHASCRHRLRHAASCGPGVESLQHHVLRTGLLRGVQRARHLGDRKPPLVPGAQRIDGQALGSRRRQPDRRIRRRHGSVRGVADPRSRCSPARPAKWCSCSARAYPGRMRCRLSPSTTRRTARRRRSPTSASTGTRCSMPSKCTRPTIPSTS